MKFVLREEIDDAFEACLASSARFVLLRNAGDQLPDQLPVKQDIDILVHPEDAKQFHEALLGAGWKRGKHPWDFGSNFRFLYSMTPFRWYHKGSIFLDVAYQLACRSPNAGEWMPLDELIQIDVWSRRREEPKTPWKYRLALEVELVHLLTRCIFDKRTFNDAYIASIACLFPQANRKCLNDYLERVFFRFTPILITMLEENQYDRIRDAYHSFVDY